MKKILTTDERRESALKIGLKLARKTGVAAVSMAAVAHASGITAPRLFHVFGTAADFRKAVLKLAKKEGVTLPVGEGAPAVKKAVPLPPLPKKVAALLKKPVLPIKAGVKSAAKKALEKKAAAPLPVVAKTPAEKFKSLPKPFEASIAAVAPTV